MCDCQSYNRPDIGTVPALVRKGICLDACIADTIIALWSAGVETLGCCCGHNGALSPAPTVMLANAEQVPLAVQIILENDPDRPWQVTVWSHQ